MSKNTQHKILIAASQEFAEKGYAGARLDSISKRAEINKALIYYYYSDKEKLYSQILSSILQKPVPVQQFIEEILEKEITRVEKIAMFLYFIAKLHLDVMRPIHHRILSWEIAEGGPFFARLLPDIIQPRQLSLISLIEDGISCNEFELRTPIELLIWNMASSVLYLGNHRQLAKKVYSTKSTQHNPMRNLIQRDSSEIYQLILANFLFNLGLSVEEIDSFSLAEPLEHIVDTFINQLKAEQNQEFTYAH